jgi:actin-related protein
LGDYRKELRNIYLTGTGVIINNIDLFFQEYFAEIPCEIIRPYFINKDVNNLKDIIEVNSATAIALNGLDSVKKEMNFYSASAAGPLTLDTIKKKFKNVDLKATMEKFATTFKELDEKLKEKTTIKIVKKRKKAKVDFAEDEVQDLKQELDTKVIDYLDAWLIRVSLGLMVGFSIYTGVAYYAGQILSKKSGLADKTIADIRQELADIESDTTQINSSAVEYQSKTNKLEDIINQIIREDERSFNIPNLLSQIMFMVPDDVKISSLEVATNNEVLIEANSGKYSQLGYFVSKLKLENILYNVDMEVLSMDNDIKIKVSGDLK